MSRPRTWVIQSDHKMHCKGCVSSVEFALKQIYGVEHVEADFHTQHIVVVGNGEIVWNTVEAEISTLGYQVRDITSEQE